MPVKAIVPSVALVIVSPFNKVMEVVEAMPSSWITPSVALLIVSPLSNVNMVVVAPPRKVPRPVKVDAPETVSAPVRAIVPSVALVIVSPLSRVMEVVEAMPSSWITPSVALLIVSPLSSVNVVVVAPPRNVLKPVTESVPPVLMFVLIVDAAFVTAKTKENDTSTVKATEKKFLIFINYFNL